MSWNFYFFQNSKESWLIEAMNLYSRKIRSLQNFILFVLKSPKISRGQQEQKILKEEDILLEKIGSNEFLILFDERGKKIDSLNFAKKLQDLSDQGVSKISFLVGGAYGVGEEVKKRANLKINLSPMTLNHHIATIVALEQIYRALSINKGLPYHNI